MKINAIVTFLALSAVETALATPVPEAADVPATQTGRVQTDADGNIISHTILSSEEEGLVKRSTPLACSFGGKTSDFEYAYYKNAGYLVPGKQGSVCLGWETGGVSSCGHAWDANARSNIKDSIARQIKKDGFGKSSDAGGWSAVWGGFTTAFRDNHDGIWRALFNAQYNGGGDGVRKSFTYYYGRKAGGENHADIAATSHALHC